MLPFAEEGDDDCREAMFENLAVIGRMNERIEMLRREVEGRGMRWGESEVEDAKGLDGEVNGDGRMANGERGVVMNGTGAPAPRQPSGRLTDEELRRQLEAHLGEQEGEDDGVHL